MTVEIIEVLRRIPEEWYYIDPEMTVPVDFSLDDAYQLLKEHERDNFWDTP